VEHPCHQCNTAIEEGTPFCPQCGAPQIRVPGIESEADIGTVTAPAAIFRSPKAVEWSHGLPAAALAGLISAILMIIPLGGLGVGMLAGGTLAVMLYRRRLPLAHPSAAMGARLGAASGAIAFALFCLLTAIQVLVFHSGNQLRAALLESVQQTAARTTDPQAKPVLDYLRSSAGLELVMAIGLVVMFVVFLVVSSAGGAIGAALMSRSRRL
jgi:hypothetical protein